LNHAQLALDEITPTIPSLHSSITTFKLPSNDRIIRLIDVPGHPRLKGEAKSRLRIADGAIFVIDAGVASRQEGAARIAEYVIALNCGHRYVS
jgi:signal recognition particle receptor subunit beta